MHKELIEELEADPNASMLDIGPAQTVTIKRRTEDLHLDDVVNKRKIVSNQNGAE